ncbi:hypothetical protein [Sporomusa aerivorans]|uniref:hypothetical protein n=1 Tax=Sporomusa aerivorans TaxID=204936 RepID=UPI003529E465
MVTLEYTSVNTEGKLGNAQSTYDTLQQAVDDIKKALFSEGCSIINPKVTDNNKRYNIELLLKEA